MSRSVDDAWKQWNLEHPERRMTRSEYRLEKTRWNQWKPEQPIAPQITSDSTDLERVFLWPDTHVPYHSVDAFGLALRAREAFRPHHTIILGDFADCMAISDHVKELDRRQDFVWEVEQVNKALDRIRDLGDKKYYVMGNHEARLQRYVSQRAPELYRMLSIEELFKLGARGWDVTQYGHSMKLGRLHVTHDEGNAGPLAAVKARDTFQGNVAIGHNHVACVSYQGRADGSAVVGASFGWLGDLDTISYMHRVRAQKWTHGVGIAYVEKSTGNVHVQAVPFIDGRCLIEGKLIS